jgi:hypothetical protein
MPPETENTFVDFFESDYYTQDKAVTDLTLEEEEEKKRKEEEEKRLKELKQAAEVEQENEVQIKETLPTEQTQEGFVDFFDSEYFAPTEKSNVEIPLDESISFARKVDYGMAQEPTAIGSAYRLIKSGVQAAIDPNESYKEARARIENERQEEIFEEFSEFRGRQEDAGVMVGRGAMALIDPVTFLIPWTKIAKAGKIASISSGAGVAAVDLSLREEALYGEVKPETVALGLGLGAAGAGVGELVMAYARRGVKTTVDVPDETGKIIQKEVDIPAAEGQKVITKEAIKDADEVAETVFVQTEETTRKLGLVYNRLDDIDDEIKVINKAKKDASKKPTAQEINELDVAKLSEKQRDFVGEIKKLRAEKVKLKAEKFKLKTELIPEDLLEIASASWLEGVKKNIMTEGIARAITQEMVRPLFGGVIGAGLGASFTEEGDDNTAMIRMAAVGFIAGAVQRKIQTSEFKIMAKGPKDAIIDEVDKQYKRSTWTYLKSLTAGSHVQDLMAQTNAVVNYAAKMFKMQGGGVTLGKVTKDLSVEEEALRQSALWRNELVDLVGDVDTEVMILAGKIVNQRGLNSKKASFLKPDDLTNPKFADAEKLAVQLDDYTLRFKDYAKQSGLDFTDEVSYGLTQILKDSSVTLSNRVEIKERLADAFVLQSKNDPTIKTLSKKQARNIAHEYLNSSTSLRNNSIWAPENSGKLFQANGVEDIKGIVKSSDEDFILTAARHFNRKRTLHDQEARALVADLFEDNPLITLKQLTENTVKIAEFAKIFGAKGQGIKESFKEIEDDIWKLLDTGNKFKTAEEFFKNNLGAKAMADQQKQKVKHSLEAYFKVYGAAGAPTTETGKAVVAVLQAGLATTRLGKVAIPSMGDWLQTITNSGYKASWKSALDQIVKSRTGKSVEALALSKTIKQVDGKDATFIDKFLGNNRYDTIIERELSDIFFPGGGTAAQVQRQVTSFTNKFFEVVQLGRVTRVARNFAFDAGTYRAMDIAKKVGKGKKVTDALQKEIDAFGLTPENLKYLSKFNNLDDAFADTTGKTFLTRAGIKSADRDALIPTVGNRRLFTQSRNHWVKFLGSFMSWSQAKTSQTNAIVARMEQGDAALAFRVMAAMPLYYTVLQTKNFLLGEKSQDYLDEQSVYEEIGELISFNGLNTYSVDKARSLAKSYKITGGIESFPEQFYPVLGWMFDVGEIPFKAAEVTAEEGAVEGGKTLLKEVSEVTPIIKDVVPFVQKFKEEPRSFSMGGIVGEELIQGPEVPFTQDNAADRINPITGLPYNQPAITYK